MSEEATSTATEATAETTAAADATLVTEATTETTEAKAEGETEAATETAETTEAKADETEETTEAKADDETKEPEGAPEEYAEFKMPEGIELDSKVSDQFKGIAKELNLTQDQAQKLVDVAAEMRQNDVNLIVETRKGWIDATKADPEIGGDKLDATIAAAKRGLDVYGTPQFIELLNQTGLGNHPEVVRVMANVGRAVSEDTKVISGGKPTEPRHHTIADRLFTPKAK